ncbi:MAG: EAL domain-containing protein [Bacillota bacterium]|nr:EAL domain-containing protein [Bacillota bacterium]
MNRRGTIILLILLTIVTTFPPPTYATITNEFNIVVGDDIDYPPYSFLDADGRPSGFNIELAEAVLAVMGLKAEFRLGNWNEIRKQLEIGEINVISGMFSSPERLERYDFTTKHTISSGDVFTRKEMRITNIQELAGATVVVQEDDIVYEYLVNENLNIEFVKVATVADALRLVSMGKYDYAAVLKVPGHYIIDSLGFTDLRANNLLIGQNEYSMAVQKNNENLLLILNSGLKILKINGQYQEIYDKWLGVYEEQRLWDQVKQYTWLVAAIFGIILLLVVWSITLRRTVASRTMELLNANQILREKQELLNASNEEIEAAYQEIAASEEELRAQYDEIQSYTNRLESLKEKYQIAILGTNSVVWEYSISDRSIYLSEEFKKANGLSLSENEKVDIVLDKLLAKEEQKKLVQEFLAYKRGKKDEIYIQVKIIARNNIKWMLIRGKGIFGADHKLRFINGVILDITKLKEQESYIEHLAYHDHLTDLPNRRRFMQVLSKELAEERPGAIMLLDLDNFKQINDTLGHIYGDKVLKKVANSLLSLNDTRLFISRFGGDEFAILLFNEKDVKEVEKWAKKIMDIFVAKLLVEEDEIYISGCLGVTIYPLDSNDITELFINADVAMYTAKELGNNNYILFNQQMTYKLQKKAQIEKSLRKALREKDFKLLYQPQVCTLTGEIVGLEALLRLKDSSIPPSEFIPIAEETGMIIEIGRWVIKEAIDQIRLWKQKGLNIKPIAINFSAKQLNDLKFINFLEETLKSENIQGELIDIEITESIFLEKKNETITFLEKVKNLGVKIVLDDFGTGYSSLSYLTFLPVDKIKLDKSLNDKFLVLENISVMDSLISLAHSLNLQVVAEGIEEIEQYNRLKAVKCDFIQGYLFSKPIEAHEIEKILDHCYN